MAGRRFSRRPWRPLILASFLAAWVLLRWYQTSRLPREPEVLSPGPASLAEVIDGDTLRLTNRARIRLLGVDTPEIHHDDPSLPADPLALEARDFVVALTRERPIRLEFDRERIDRYGRFLAYVWVGDQLLNEELLRAGLARGLFEYPYSEQKKRRFRAAQAEAQAARRGIWAIEPAQAPATQKPK